MFDPGWPAITIPYHEMLDFFFSGHIGNTFIWTWELYQQGETTLLKIGLFIHFIMWPFLVIIRTHYWIDMITGLIVGHWSILMAEQLNYLVDSKMLGFNGIARK